MPLTMQDEMAIRKNVIDLMLISLEARRQATVDSVYRNDVAATIERHLVEGQITALNIEMERIIANE